MEYSLSDLHKQLRQRILFGLLLILTIVYVFFEYHNVGDFLIYYQASKDFFLHKNIYVERYGDVHVFPYYGSPTLAFLLGPFTLLPFPIAAALWKIINFFFLYRIWIALESYFDTTILSSKEYGLFILASFFSVSFVVYRNFTLNQFTVFLLFSILEGIHLIFHKKKPFFGAVLLSLGIVCKILPLVIIPYVLYRGQFKATFLIVLSIAFWLLLPVVFLGWQECGFILGEWARSIDPNNEMNIFDVSTNDIHGIPSLISILFIEGIGINEYTLTIKRNIASIDPQLVKILIQISRILLVVFTLFFLRSKPFEKEKGPRWQLWELGYILLVTPLVFPQQRLYAFFFFFPAITYLTYQVIRINQDRVETGEKIPFLFYLYVFCIVIFNLELVLGHFREYYWHFKTLTYSALLILCVYAKNPPSLIKSSS